MKITPIKAIEIQFGKIGDPRVNRTKEHKLIDVITISICAIICGAQGWTEIEMFGNQKYAWLKTFLELPGGIPSHDTFGRVFSMLDPQEFQDCFMEWVEMVNEITSGQVVSIDGKQLRGSDDYISSLDSNAKLILHAARRHWSIENELHWVSDVALNENRSVFAKIMLLLIYLFCVTLLSI